MPKWKSDLSSKIKHHTTEVIFHQDSNNKTTNRGKIIHFTFAQSLCERIEQVCDAIQHAIVNYFLIINMLSTSL